MVKSNNRKFGDVGGAGAKDFGANPLLFANVYATEADLPSASTYHGMFAHVHATGRAYYSHAGNWIKLVEEDSSGNIAVTGTVDGRDVSADGTKLDGVESGATSDQTAAEIRTLVGSATDSNVFTDADHTKLDAIESGATGNQTDAEIKVAYENNSDTNAFTDALQTKLNGIEASATADQTAAEIRTLVDSATDSNVFTDADHTKLDAIETSATADQTDAEIKTAYENNSDTNAFTDAFETKLTGIETSADVTDATNVAAAGAVMEGDTTTASMSFVVDEDDMTSDSATKLPTQQSVKAYVDTQLATQDALSELSGDSDDITQGSTNLFMTTSERTKLTGIEASATADQTDAEIRAAVEAATDSNVFTDDDHTKLNGIETSATADQTAAEILTAIKTVDGPTSGLNADLLDGNEATYFLNTSTVFGGDASGTYDAIVIADDSHNHIISNVDNLQTTLDAKLALAGGTLAGSLVLHADPTASLQAATKQYVDTIASAGLHYHQPVRVEHPSNLNVTYNNGSSGVGATLTNAGSNAAIELDGVTLSLNDRVLVANQTNQAHNGVYKVTTTGDGSTAWVLTRTTDTDSYAPSDPDAFGKGDAFFIKEGDTNSGHLDVLSTSGAIVFGTTNIIFSEVAETTVYAAGTGLTLSGTTFSADQAIATTATPTFAGLTVNGDITVTGNVDGRDVSADGTKLDGIESAATADQTAAEIRTLVDSATDSNVFTDNDHTKLDNIEASATADQTDAEIKTAYENNSDTNAFTDTLLSKLNAIEASATADQSASDIEAIVSHDNLLDYVANEHINWTTDQGATNIHINNIVAASNSTSGLMASADKVKLDAIESNATADQTDAEIKTAYENNSDTNAFTDTLLSKLNGIASSANNYTHPNHSGEVTSTADGATVIVDNVVDEANLKVSNSPSNGYFLQAQSGNTGGLTWAAVSAGYADSDVNSHLNQSSAGSNQILSWNGSDYAWVDDANTTYSVGDGGLTQKNFTTTLKNKLDGIESGATADQTKADIDALNIDADTLDGLNLHTGRNDEANKIVRTQGNGYAQFGWINTTSGTAGTIDRVYCSQDGYIRYLSPANFKSQLGLNNAASTGKAIAMAMVFG